MVAVLFKLRNQIIKEF